MTEDELKIIFDSLRVIDLTHPLSEKIPSWNGSCGFCLEIKRDYDEVFRVQKIKMHAGVGTHMDAPSHRFQEGASIAEIALKDCIVPLRVVDVSQKAHQDYQITVEDILYHEQKYGRIPARALCVGYTGWDRYWGDPATYRNVDGKGVMHFPSFSEEAASLLIDRGIAGLAIDTLSPDAPHSDFPVHRIILGAGKYIIENIANISSVPPIAAYAIALPLYAEGAAEAPMRLIALIP
ncbi:MAG: cyclase family protein [Simkaniaceae bacterium]|nr:cyclase family protein [Simkaniaceae bacterium]